MAHFVLKQTRPAPAPSALSESMLLLNNIWTVVCLTLGESDDDL